MRYKVGSNAIRQYISDDRAGLYDVSEVLSSWENAFAIKDNAPSGLRHPQRGALYAIKAHWTVSKEPVTIVMPTGTGKTEVMIATVVSEIVGRTMVIVPSDMLRKQTAEKFLSFGILQENGVIDASAITPTVTALTSKPKNIDELIEILDKSNVIITTMSLLRGFSDDFYEEVNKRFDALIVDEAHHVPASSWTIAKHKLRKLKCLQLTATPFRNDGKKIDGRIIYNFPLSLSQEQGYFEKIDFIALEEFDDEKGDRTIAEAAIQRLESDLEAGFEHIVLVRANSKNYADYLYKNIYETSYARFNPVLIYSGITKSEKKERMDALNNGTSKVVVCVDMFGEGIDIPNLKIAAIHEKHKSLPITLQFIGRFARARDGLGTAAIITNIANDELNSCLTELYAQDSDWNRLLHLLSKDAIQREVSQQDFSDDFDLTYFEGMKIDQLRPKVSMIAYKTNMTQWDIEALFDKFDPDKTRFAISEENGVVVVIERVDSSIDWTSFKGINDINWDLHVVYWNRNTKMFFVNSTNKGIYDKIAKALFGSYEKVVGEVAFRCLYDIKRLMLGTVGLQVGIDGPIRYKMFAGVDIKDAISEAQTENSYKSNLFGTGYKGKGKISIGCSYKGKIWSRWVESINFWMEWCDDIATHLLDETIDPRKILDGVLIPEQIKAMPIEIPYSIEWPIDLELVNDLSAMILHPLQDYSIYETEIFLSEQQSNEGIRFIVESANIKEEFELRISDAGFTINTLKSSGMEIKVGKQRSNLRDFFTNYPPRIKFVDQSTLEGNLLVRLKTSPPPFKVDRLISTDWSDVNIRKESQGEDRQTDSIQYHIIQQLKDRGDCCVIFDDDGRGEIADIIAIIEKPDKVYIQFYHCKYSKGDNPGSRVDDLYEVCGQTEKSVRWCQDKQAIITRMQRRESNRQKNNTTRFEIGSLKKLKELKNKMRLRPAEVEIFIVQPGLSATAITDDVMRLLGGTASNLMDTFSIDLKVICSP